MNDEEESSTHSLSVADFTGIALGLLSTVDVDKSLSADERCDRLREMLLATTGLQMLAYQRLKQFGPIEQTDIAEKAVEYVRLVLKKQAARTTSPE